MRRLARTASVMLSLGLLILSTDGTAGRHAVKPSENTFSVNSRIPEEQEPLSVSGAGAPGGIAERTLSGNILTASAILPGTEAAETAPPEREAETEDLAVQFDPDTGAPGMGIADTEAADTAVPGVDIPGGNTGNTEENNPGPDIPDAGIPDTGVPDAGIPDADVPDADIPDAGIPDTDIPDAGIPDTDIPAEDDPAEDLPAGGDTEDENGDNTGSDAGMTILNGFYVSESGVICGIADPAAVVSDSCMTFPSSGCSGISADAFAAVPEGVREVYIPANITYIEEGAFSGFTEVEWYEMEPSGEFFTENGVIFSAGGTCLFAFPPARTDTYYVPSGVAAIAPGAFAGSQLSKLDIRACEQLDVSVLPEYIEVILPVRDGEVP